MLSLPQLEVHIAHGCNYGCKSCSHFSQFHHQGMLRRDTAYEWYKMWADRINPGRLSLLGGEPTLNKELIVHVLAAIVGFQRLSYELQPMGQNCIAT